MIYQYNPEAIKVQYDPDYVDRAPVDGGGVSAWVVKVVGDDGAVMAAGDRIFANTSGGSFGLLLPVSATLSDTICICDFAGSFTANPFTIARNGHKIMRLEDDLELISDNDSIELTYSGIANGWIITCKATTA